MKSLLQRFYMLYDYPFRYATMNLACWFEVYNLREGLESSCGIRRFPFGSA